MVADCDDSCDQSRIAIGDLQRRHREYERRHRHGATIDHRRRGRDRRSSRFIHRDEFRGERDDQFILVRRGSNAYQHRHAIGRSSCSVGSGESGARDGQVRQDVSRLRVD